MEEYIAKKNVMLDSIIVKDIPKGPKGKEILDITFEYDLNGILDVEVKILSTGEKNVIQINRGKSEEIKEDKEEDEEDYSTIYTEISYLSKYINKELDKFDLDIQAKVRQDLQIILTSVKINDFEKCREMEHEILRLMGVEE